MIQKKNSTLARVAKVSIFAVALAVPGISINAYSAVSAQSGKQEQSNPANKAVADAELETRISALLGQLTQAEKISLLSGASGFGTTAIERLGIRGMNFTDGTNGVRSNDRLQTTAFPVGLLVAATWDRSVAEQIGVANGEEANAVGAHVLLAPNLNLVRTPLAGRNFETYGEDPLLSGAMGASFISGVQSKGVATSAKHYVGNEQETERSRSSSNIDERTLRELYLKPFELVVRSVKPWTIMTSYNRVHGTYMSENRRLVREVLKGEWNYDGVVMSDWGGTHSFMSVENGLDLEMPGPPRQLGPVLLAAVRNFQVSQTAVDEGVRRMLRLAARTGNLEPLPGTAATPAKAPVKAPAVISTPEHRQLARQTAAQGITLLKNSAGLLPLDGKKIRSIAVIGPNADAAVIQGGGSAEVLPSDIVSPLDALRKANPQIRLTYIAGVDNNPITPTIDARFLSPTRERRERGLAVEYFTNDNFSGTAARTGVEQSMATAQFTAAMAPDLTKLGNDNLSVRWQGYFWPTVSGEYEFFLENIIPPPGGRVEMRLSIDNKQVIDPGMPIVTLPSVSPDVPLRYHGRRVLIPLTAGQPVALKLEYVGAKNTTNRFRLGLRVPAGSIDEAVRLAREADVALVFVGSSQTSETEGRDRDSLRMFGQQDQLVAAVAAANPKTIVVLNNAGPLEMPWVDQVPAVVEAWLPGQEGAHAVADVLFGRVNPSGKLPVTFPKRLQDNPAYLYFPGGRDVEYGEGLFMGYRYYDKKEIEPLFPFGHGLSYTTFTYENLRVTSKIKTGENLDVSVMVRNSGTREGQEVAQLYLQQLKCVEACPIRELKGFEKIKLKPGESRNVTFKINTYAMRHYDIHEAQWMTMPGHYQIAVGGSSRDLPLNADFVIEK